MLVTPTWGGPARDTRSLPALQRFDVKTERRMATYEQIWSAKVQHYEVVVETASRAAQRGNVEVEIACVKNDLFEAGVRSSRQMLATPLTREQEATRSLSERRRGAQESLQADCLRREALAKRRAMSARDEALASHRADALEAMRTEEALKVNAKALQQEGERGTLLALEARRHLTSEIQAQHAAEAAERRADQRTKKALRSPCRFRNEAKLSAFVTNRRRQKEEMAKHRLEASRWAAQRAEARSEARLTQRAAAEASQRRDKAKDYVKRLEKVRLAAEAAAARSAAEHRAYQMRLDRTTDQSSVEDDSYGLSELDRLRKLREAAAARAATLVAAYDKAVAMATTPRNERKEQWHVTREGFRYFL